MNIIVTVDTEADDQWNRKGPMAIDNVFALPRFQALCEKYNMPATYLLTYEVAADERAAAQFRAWQEKGAEIGSHLHPWTTPPIQPEDESKERFPSELNEVTLREKFSNLNDAVKKAMGKQPTSYRAGRWGFDDRQAKLLEEFGYVVDLSVTPGISWADKGGPDFTGVTAREYRLNKGAIEVPMTILPAGWFGRLRWLRVFENTTYHHLKDVIDTAERDKFGVVVFMIHSSELVEDKSPYVKTKAALERVYGHVESLFSECQRRRIIGVTASAYANLQR